MQALARRLDALAEMRQMEANRLEVAATAAVKESLAEHIAFLDREIARAEGLIRSHIDNHHGLRGQRDLLLTIPGIGETRRKQLIRHFGSARKIREASMDDLKAAPGLGDALAETVWRHLHGAETGGAGRGTT